MLPTKFQFIWLRGFSEQCQVMAKAHIVFGKVSKKWEEEKRDGKFLEIWKKDWPWPKYDQAQA